MAKSAADILALLDEAIGAYARMDGPIAQVRLRALCAARSHIAANGFPLDSMETKLRLSLVPYVFQECNYDGDEWGAPKDTAVKPLLDLDFWIAFDGKERAEISSDEFYRYAHAAIDAARARAERDRG